MSASEAIIQRSIMLAVSRIGAVVFRNNTGLGWIGNATKSPFTDSVVIQNARPLHAGLCRGSSDLIGWYRGRFLAIEVKSLSGRLTTEQDNFLKQVERSGGIAIVGRSVGQVLEELKRYEK